MVSQEIWNILFGWITGKQCFILEGCPPPVMGVVFYAVMLATISAVVYYIYRNGVPEWRKLL